MKTRIFIVIVLQVFLIKNIMANAAQPGLFSSGAATFSLLILEDSFAYQKLQMIDEEVYVQLYKGFTIVKGKYHIKNNSSDSISFKMGYPINSIYDYSKNGEAQEIEFDDLYNFKVLINNELVNIDIENHEKESVISFDDNNWKTWTCTYLPNENKLIEVYFLVKTNNAHIRKGYNIEHRNAFVYLFESGATWGNPILNGQLAVQLKDDLSYKNIKGIACPFDLKYNEEKEILLGSFKNLNPTQNDNFIITYGENYKNIDFESIKNYSDKYYEDINLFEESELKNLEFKEITFNNPFEVKTKIIAYFPMILTLIIIFMPFIIGFLIIVAIIVWWYKKRRKK